MAYKKIDTDAILFGSGGRNDVIPSALLRAFTDNAKGNIDGERIIRPSSHPFNHSYNNGLTTVTDITDNIVPSNFTGEFTWVFDDTQTALQSIDVNPSTIGIQFSTPVNEPVSFRVGIDGTIDTNNAPTLSDGYFDVVVALKCENMSGSMWVHSDDQPITMNDMSTYYSDLVNDGAGGFGITYSTGSNVTSKSFNISGTLGGTLEENYENFINSFQTGSLTYGAAKIGVTGADGFTGVGGINYYRMRVRSGNNLTLSFFGGIDFNNPLSLDNTPNVKLFATPRGSGTPQIHPQGIIDESNVYVDVNPDSMGKFHYAIKTEVATPGGEVRTRLGKVNCIASGIPTFDSSANLYSTEFGYGTQSTTGSYSPIYIIQPQPIQLSEIESDYSYRSPYELYPVSKFTLYSVAVKPVVSIGVDEFLSVDNMNLFSGSSESVAPLTENGAARTEFAKIAIPSLDPFSDRTVVPNKMKDAFYNCQPMAAVCDLDSDYQFTSNDRHVARLPTVSTFMTGVLRNDNIDVMAYSVAYPYRPYMASNFYAHEIVTYMYDAINSPLSPNGLIRYNHVDYISSSVADASTFESSVGDYVKFQSGSHYRNVQNRSNQYPNLARYRPENEHLYSYEYIQMLNIPEIGRHIIPFCWSSADFNGVEAIDSFNGSAAGISIDSPSDRRNSLLWDGSVSDFVTGSRLEMHNNIYNGTYDNPDQLLSGSSSEFYMNASTSSGLDPGLFNTNSIIIVKNVFSITYGIDWRVLS